MKHTAGATLMRVALKMSGLKAVSVEPGPLISIRPSSTTAIPTANKMKFILSKAKFLFVHFLCVRFCLLTLSQLFSVVRWGFNIDVAMMNYTLLYSACTPYYIRSVVSMLDKGLNLIEFSGLIRKKLFTET